MCVCVCVCVCVYGYASVCILGVFRNQYNDSY